jgi:MFS family permease
VTSPAALNVRRVRRIELSATYLPLNDGADRIPRVVWWGTRRVWAGRPCLSSAEVAVTRASSRLPPFITDLGREPGALGTLIAAGIALFAVGLDPKVLSAGMPDAQTALRERPALEALFLLSSLIQAAFLLVGGVLGDTLGRRRVLLVGMAGLAIAEIAAIVLPTGPGFLFARLLAAAGSGIVLPVALAVIAVTYNGAARATALGIAYGVLGAATAVAPPILIALSPTVGRWPSFLLAAIAMLFAFWAVRRNVPDTPSSGLPLRAIAPHALWAFGLLALTGGLVGFRANSESSIRLALIIGGVLLVGVFLLVQRRRRAAADDEYAIDLRPTTVALIAGFVLILAQTAPMLELPLFFRISQQYAPLLATIAIAPFIVALIVAGPLAGLLITRFSPRTLIVGGLAIVGIGDLLLSLAGPGTPYLFFVLPFFAVGAGFVVGTSVRTAVIFASVTRRLPATAGALNQSSLVVGAQAGVAAITAFVATASIAAYVAGQPPGADLNSAAEQMRAFLLAIGTSEFGQVIDQLPAATTVQYGAAFAAGVQQAMALVGATAVITAAFVWFAMPGAAPIESVWELREERSGAAEDTLPEVTA